MDPNGSQPVALTKDTAALFPAWSPKGWPLAYTFVSAPNGRQRIVLVGPELHRALLLNERPRILNSVRLTSTSLTTADADSFMPTWSSDGERLAFVSDRSGTPYIYTMMKDGSAQKRVSPVPGQWPSWSRDGRLIAFACTDGPVPAICTMNVDGSGLRHLTTAASAANPAWSPVRSQILFVLEKARKTAIYLMNGDGSQQQSLTEHSTDDTYPAWSPDGEYVVFSSMRDGDEEIYVMHADGSGQRRLTTRRGQDVLPTWTSLSPDAAMALLNK